MALSTTQYGYIIDPLVPLTDDTGRTISNGYVRVFMAGTSTPVITYKNFDGATNEETVQLDNSGRTAYPVIGSKGSTYKVCVYDAEHSQETPIKTIDKVVPTGASVSATNIVTGLDNVESPEAGWVKSTVSGTDAEVSLDATNVTSEVDTMVKATAASADYMMPLVHKTGSDPDKKITLKNIFKFVLNFIHSLTDTATESDITSGNYFALDGSAGTKKLNSTTLLTKTAQNALAGNVAEEFDPTRDADHKYLVNEFVVYCGRLYRFDVDHYGAWSAAHVHIADVSEILDYLENDCLIFKDFLSSAPTAKYIKTDVGVGNSVDFTPVSAGGYKYVVLPCKKGDAFKIFGQGGSASRLWCFVDSSDKVVSVASANLTLNGAMLVAPSDGKLIYNTSTMDGCYVKGVITAQEFFTDVKKNNSGYNNVISEATENYYIPTNLNVGVTIDYTPVYGSGYCYLVRSCKFGEFIKIRGVGGSTPRLWCFVDSSDKVVSVAAVGASSGADGIELVAPCDGKVIFNSEKAPAIGTPYYKELVSVQDYIDSNFEFVNKNISYLNENCRVYKEIYEDFSRGFYIATNVGVGNVVDYTPVSSGAFSYLVLNCSAGDIFKIKGNGGSKSRLWCFVDTSDKVVSVAASDVVTPSTGIDVVAPVDGKIIVNIGINSTYKSFKIQYSVQAYIDEQNKVFDERINVLEKYDIPNDPTPFSQLGSLLENLDLSLDTRMEQIYSLFDELVADYPTFVTKYDAAELVDLEYPRYANGVSAGDPDYIETPAYKTYIYKISNVNEGAGNLTAFPKKKLLIVGAVHGMEYFASVNCYALAAHLLKNISSDLFSILSLFDLWIMPCTNGYGIIHPQRPNANGVDINRNFGTSRWTENGSQELGTWSGTTPDSEFEVKLIEGLKDYINPDFYVDHHCTPGHSKAQFYTESPSKKILARSYDSLVQISDFMVKNYPAYFGSAYHLFIDFVYSQQLPYGTTELQGCSSLWFYERGIETATIEIFGYINYTDGEYDASGHRGNDLWMVSEYTLRNQLAKYLPIVLT